jgi:hypothetical protein
VKSLFRFPDPVNEVSARVVATGVVVLGVLTLVTGWTWLLVPIAYGFVARVLTGPTLSPLGQLATRVVTPRMGVAPRYVPGPPKRFAQGVGAVVTVTALVLAGFGRLGAVWALLGLLVVFAGLEAFLGFCVGCKVFGVLMRTGLIPESVCEACNDLSLRTAGRPEW